MHPATLGHEEKPVLILDDDDDDEKHKIKLTTGTFTGQWNSSMRCIRPRP